MAKPNAMIALKMPDGMLFGKVRKVSVSRILFEIERDLVLGQQLEWRMELTGWNATVLGRLQIRRFQSREDRPNLAEARIIHINGEDARRFQDWLTDLSVGGTTRRYESNPTSVVGFQTSQMSGISKAQARHALNRMDKRGMKGKQYGSTDSDAFGFTSQLSSAVSGIEDGRTGRQAMSAALKQSLKGGTRRRLKDVAPQTLSPRASITPAPKQESRTEEDGTTATTSGPRVRLEGEKGTERIDVHYDDSHSFREAWKQHIQHSGLFIDLQLSDERGRERVLKLTLPSGLSLRCSATVVAPMPSGTGLALQLQPAQLQLLRQEAARK